ncbi:gamma-glutamyl-gamma-aminobutyrate hydrolase family protein [Pseudodesulfovibrio senegalensis]|nr:gamma-glutamyl-gamma-aminobutyrate hydrolase family protein [Pseudodesulfovibrio senegalensis]
MHRPRIGVSTQDRGGFAPWLFIWLNLRLAGAVAVRITPRRPADIAGLHGVVLSGGADITPGLYQDAEKPMSILDATKDTEKRHPWWIHLVRMLVSLAIFVFRYLAARKGAPATSEARDALEVRLLQQALEKDLPILGICRGMQLVNVVCGGTLHQEIADVYEDARHPNTVFPVKNVDTAQGSRLARITGRQTLRVNGMHHQAVDALGKGLEVVARDESDMVQALEGTEKRFVLGVQWHPEYMIQFRSQRRLFRALVAAAAESVQQD